MDYTIYNIKTTKIVGFISGTIETVKLNLKEDESYIEGHYSEEEYCVKNNKAVPIEESILLEKKKTEAYHLMKTIRNEYLQNSDHKVLPDYPTNKLEEWKIYRQALRDLPANTSDPLNVTWPTPPE